MTRPLHVQRLARMVNEILILGALRDGPMHGYGIARSIEERTGGCLRVHHGTLYPVLNHLESEALIDGVWDEGNAPRRRKVYALASSGREYLRKRSAEWRELERCLGALLSQGPADVLPSDAAPLPGG